MFVKNKIAAAVGLLAALSCQTVDARFIMMEDVPRSPAQPVPSQPIEVYQPRTDMQTVRPGYVNVRRAPVLRTVVQHKGRKPAVIPQMTQPFEQEGATLEDALAIVVPQGFGIYASDGVSLADPASVKVSGTWVTALSTLLAPTALTATIDWDRHEVLLANDEIFVRAKAERTPAAAKLQKIWKAGKEDGMLSSAIQRWCQESNGECVRVEWESTYDMPLEGPAANFNGSLNDAVRSLLYAVSKTTGHVFYHRMASNRVLIVSDARVEGGQQ